MTVFLVFKVYPVILAVIMSFQNFQGVQSQDWVGLSNYQNVFELVRFNQALTNTTVYTIGTILILIPLPLILAVLLFSGRVAGSTLFRTLIFLPALTSLVVAGTVFRLILAEEGFLAVHAAPWWPEGLETIQDFGRWLRETGESWRSLFPYLRDAETIWRALAELESAAQQIVFHGHTHRQAIWRWEPTGRLSKVEDNMVAVDLKQRFVVGVGSVGLPEDGGWARYCIYDAEAGRIELIRLD